ncbi:hypothetical protein SBRCBS47491_005928 [Sporothrix bragantina]|uniref:Co-chaperone HscB C-terminal oligomerisation domain-containing protein n=1 Tax=Sporothrix bragantina TaxID=671064 RepID=A0ABP0C2N1_9PEZI
MPFTSLPSLARTPLCAQCARAAARRVPATAATATRAASSSRTLAAARPTMTILSATSSPLRHVRFLSSTSRTPTAAPVRGQPASDPSTSPSSPSSSASSASSGPSFYALFPKTLTQGPPPAGPFAINVRALRTEFLQLQAAAHPDFHHDQGAPAGRDSHSSGRAKAEALSSLINEAYRTLASPLLRAQYLLKQRHGIDLAGDESTVGGATEMDLLMAVLEVREEIEQAQSEADLEPIRAANQERIQASEAVLEKAFAADDADTARREAVRLRYWVNIDDALRNWERGKDIVLEH